MYNHFEVMLFEEVAGRVLGETGGDFDGGHPHLSVVVPDFKAVHPGRVR